MFLNCCYSSLSHPPFFNMLGGFNIPIKSIEGMSVSFFSMKWEILNSFLQAINLRFCLLLFVMGEIMVK